MLKSAQVYLALSFCVKRSLLRISVKNLAYSSLLLRMEYVERRLVSGMAVSMIYDFPLPETVWS